MSGGRGEIKKMKFMENYSPHNRLLGWKIASERHYGFSFEVAFEMLKFEGFFEGI